MRVLFSIALAVAALSVFSPGGTAIAAPQPPTDGVAFNGKTTYAVVDDGKAFDLPAFTLAAWVKMADTKGTQVFLNRSGRAQLFTFYLFNNQVRMLVEYETGSYTHANTAPPKPDTWTHYAGTYDGKAICLYVNGKLVHTTKAPGRMSSSEEPLYLGAESPGANGLNGMMEDVRVWKRALNADEVATVAAGGDAGSDAMLARWRRDTFGEKTWRNALGDVLAARFRADATPVKVPTGPMSFNAPARLILQKDDGYRGIWYSNQPSKDEYVYKYSGGLGTYPANHIPFAVYAPAVNKTFFCYGGTVKGKHELLHMVSYYDHATGMVPRPTILLNKATDDAHDNPVISLDDEGYIWIFSSSHGTARPSYITRSTRPYSIDSFENVLTTNFSYPQVWHIPGQGFLFMHTRYEGGRCIYQMTSRDGKTWSEGRLLAKIDEGHYQVTGRFGKKVGSAFMYHPKGKGLNWRTNLYYMESDDFGKTWRNAAGEALELPLKDIQNKALIHDYQAEGLNVYIQDITFDAQGRPVILFITSKGYESGPKNDPRTWRTARWTGKGWDIQGSITSGNNYDCGSIYMESDSLWRIIGPTQFGPQRYNPGGEMALWVSKDQGKTWKMERQLTRNSEFNHTYARRPVNPHSDFYALWADGHGRQPSESRLYFTNKAGDRVWQLPTQMTGEFAKPVPVR